LKNLLLLLPFFKPQFPPFSLVPGEIIPWFILKIKHNINDKTLFFVFTTLLYLLVFLFFFNPQSRWLIDFFEIFFIAIFLLNIQKIFPVSFIEKHLKKFSIYFLVLGCIDFFLLNNMLTSFIAEAPSRDILFEFNRGASFFAPEPSYLGIFSAGMAIFSLRNNFVIPFIIFSLIVFLTISLWSMGLYLFTLFFFVNWRYKLFILCLALLALTLYLLEIISLSSRMEIALDFILDFIQNNSFYDLFGLLVSLDEQFGSERFSATFTTLINGSIFPNGDYYATFSMLSQFIRIFGLYFGFLFFLFLFIGFLRETGGLNLSDAFYLLLITFFWGPVPLITNYFPLIKLKKLK
jgi:hypothetical protein